MAREDGRQSQGRLSGSWTPKRCLKGRGGTAAHSESSGWGPRLRTGGGAGEPRAPWDGWELSGQSWGRQVDYSSRAQAEREGQWGPWLHHISHCVQHPRSSRPIPTCVHPPPLPRCPFSKHPRSPGAGARGQDFCAYMVTGGDGGPGELGPAPGVLVRLPAASGPLSLALSPGAMVSLA